MYLKVNLGGMFVLVALIGTTYAQGSGGGAGGAGGAGTSGAASAGASGSGPSGAAGSGAGAGAQTPGSSLSGAAGRANAAGSGNPANVNAPLSGTNQALSSPPTSEAAGTSALQQDDLRRTQSGTLQRSGAGYSNYPSNLDSYPNNSLRNRATSNGARAAAGTNQLSGDWRYVQYRGRHWYWMPNETWNVWDGYAWRPYSGRATSANAPVEVRGYRGRRMNPLPGNTSRATQPVRPGSMATALPPAESAPLQASPPGGVGGVRPVPGANAVPPTNTSPTNGELDLEGTPIERVP